MKFWLFAIYQWQYVMLMSNAHSSWVVLNKISNIVSIYRLFVGYIVEDDSDCWSQIKFTTKCFLLYVCLL